MSLKKAYKIIITLMLSFSVSCTFPQEQVTKSTAEKKVVIPKQHKDSIKLTQKNVNNIKDTVKKGKLTLQDKIDIAEIKIDAYYMHLHEIKSEDKNISQKKLKIKNYQNEIKKYQEKIKILEKSIKQAKDISSKSIEKTDFLKDEFSSDIKKINKELNSITGELKFIYKNTKYFVFVADLKKHDIKLHLNYRNTKDKNAQKFISLNNVKDYLENVKIKEVLMLTNGGMYTPKNNPEGLLIADTVEIEPIDLGDSQRMLNFYLKPNGIFYIQNGKAYIEESSVFNSKYIAKEISPEQATQSGPMLVIDGNHHPALNHGSSSKKLRSGVGIMNNGKVIFIISEKSSVTNFHDFATIFKDIFGCKNALFLDGVISKMYLKTNNPSELSGGFGPIISVTKK